MLVSSGSDHLGWLGPEDEGATVVQNIRKYSRTSIYCFSRGWRKQTLNVGKRLIRETTFFNKKSHTMSFASWQNFASIENMTFRDLRCFHGLRRLHFAHRKTL